MPQMLDHIPDLQGQKPQCPDERSVNANCRHDTAQDLKERPIWLPVPRPECKDETTNNANRDRRNQKAEICLMPS